MSMTGYQLPLSMGIPAFPNELTLTETRLSNNYSP